MSPRSVLLISGPSGVGKTTIASELVKEPGFERVVTATTRPPRPGERSGIDYHFMTDAAFENGIERGRFLEHAEVHGRRYGTPRDDVMRILDSGATAVLTIDVQGMKQIRQHSADLPLVTVFLTPPDRDELIRRLGRRGSETEEEIATRLVTAERELAEQDAYDHVVVNDDLEDTVAELRRLALEARQKT